MLRFAGMLALAGVFMALAIWWQVFRFEDCRAVGHSLTYCILTIGQ